MVSERNSDCWYNGVCQNECSESCIRYLEMSYMVENSGIPKSKQHPIELVAGVDLDAYRRLDAIRRGIVEFVSDGKNLYICSEHTGNGKTSWAIKLLLKYFNDVWAGNGFRTRGLMVHVPTLLLQLKDFDNPLSNDYKQSILHTDVVVWDDIAHAGVSKYDYNNLLSLLDNRLFNGRSNIFTSNVTRSADLHAMLGGKLASRIWGMSEIITFEGKDRRRG